MLTVVLGILRILGIVLLCLLGTVLVILLLVLFWPVTYNVRGRREPNGTDEDGAVRWDTEVRARFKWLFGFVNGGIDFPEPGKLTVRVLWFTVFSLGIMSGEKKKADKQKETGKAQKADDKKQAGAKETEAEASADEGKTAEKTSAVASGTDAAAPAGEETGAEASSAEAETSPKKGIAGLFEKIRYTISNICDKIREIRTKEHYYRRILTAEDTKGLLRHVWMRLGRLLRAIRPRHVRAEVHFGTGSPDTTGYALALYGMVCPRIGWAVSLTPDFEEKVFEGKGKLSGHIVIAVVLWHVAKVALDRRLHWLIRRLKADPSKQ